MEVSDLAINVFHFNLGLLDLVSRPVQVLLVLLGPSLALTQHLKLLLDYFGSVPVDLITLLERGLLFLMRLPVDLFDGSLWKARRWLLSGRALRS